MKLFALMFCLFATVAMSQNEISMNTGNGPGNQTNVANNNKIPDQQINLQVQSNENINPADNQTNIAINNDVPIQTGNNIIYQQGNINTQVQTQQRNPVVQTSNRSSGSSSSSFSSGTRKKTNMFKTVSKKIQVFQYKHKGKKKYQHRNRKPSRSCVLRCF